MKNNQEKIEHVVWIENDFKNHAIGFVIEEKKNYLVMALTKSYGEYLDTKKIEVDSIESRTEIKL